MKIELSIKDDAELRNTIKDMIKGSVTSVVRESVDAIIAEAIRKQVENILPKEVQSIVSDFLRKQDKVSIASFVQVAISKVVTAEVENQIFWKAHEMMNRDIKGIESLVDAKLKKVKLSL